MVTKHIPKYRKHSSGQARVTLAGQVVYLGKFGTPESIECYHRVISEWLAGNRSIPAMPSSEVTIGEVVIRYLDYATQRYRKNGRQTKELSALRCALRPLVKLYKSTMANEFRVQALAIVRHDMISSKWCRKSINAHMSRIKTMFKWAHVYLGVSEAVAHSLATLKGLRPHEFDVPESDDVKPVEIDAVKKTQAAASRMLADMIELQLLAGMRPGEVVLMQADDINTDGPIWIYRPSEHKLQHFGLSREIELGPKAQAIISCYLPEADSKSYLFQPASRSKGRYSVDSYRRAIHRACDRAWPPPEKFARAKGEKKYEWLLRMKITGKWDALQAWHSEHRWSPNQLRHTAGTIIRDKYNLEVAAAVLGHTRVSTTEIYAERSRRTARTAISEMG